MTVMTDRLITWRGWTIALWLAVSTAVVGEEAKEDRLFVIDNMDKVQNALRLRCAVYQHPPDRILYSKSEEYGHEGSGLRLTFHKVNVGGPYGQGGWCGYYTLLFRGDRYFDASKYTHFTFWIRGEQGGERLQVGLADKQLAMIQDSVKSKPIEDYLPEKKVTTEWQKAVVPLSDMFVDYAQTASVSLCFESPLYEDEEVQGTIYVDDLAFEIDPS